MKIHNILPQFLACLKKWEQKPTQAEFLKEYFQPNEELLAVIFDGGSEEFYSVLEELDWKTYRTAAILLDPKKEEQRVLKYIQKVEKLFGFPLEGSVLLFGAFACMDGYARFDRGTHCVYLGVDESHHRDGYLDILIAHELTHVARESRGFVWESFGLDPKMTHDQFTDTLPVIEHLFGEGFSCAVSELLVPDQDPWLYAYQSKESLAQVLSQAAGVEKQIKKELAKRDGDYGRLYDPRLYGKNLPSLSHYVWAWQWAKQLLEEKAHSDPKKLISISSREMIQDAMQFKLKKIT